MYVGPTVDTIAGAAESDAGLRQATQFGAHVNQVNIVRTSPALLLEELTLSPLCLPESVAFAGLLFKLPAPLLTTPLAVLLTPLTGVDMLIGLVTSSCGADASV